MTRSEMNCSLDWLELGLFSGRFYDKTCGGCEKRIGRGKTRSVKYDMFETCSDSYLQ